MTQNNAETLKGRLTITRSSDNTMRLEVIDEASRTCFLRVKIDPANLMLALTSVAEQPMEFELRGLDKIGKRLEFKRVFVKVPNVSQIPVGDAFVKWYEELVEPYEVDGWKADKEHRFNSHRYDNSNGTYQVWFRRYVED